jgi:sulfur relay (sulfurtransferase) DsrF/TusC family protein
VNFVDLILAVHDSFVAAGVEHSFGGALALMHHVAEPRTTWDIDVNVSVGTADAGKVLEALSSICSFTKDQELLLIRDGQVRLMAGRNPVDIFLAVDDFHKELHEMVVWRPFGERVLPYISATHLTVMKAFYDRPKDWVDIVEMLKRNTVDVPKAIGWLALITNERDERPARLRALALIGERGDSMEMSKSDLVGIFLTDRAKK